MPHDKLGEEVAAAVVLREGATATERELRDFCATRLADFKVPRKVVVLAGDPEGRDRQAPAHRPGARSWASCREMKICVVGAGAIGGLLAAKLAAIGHEVSVVVRGPHLAAIRERGLTLQDDGTERTFAVRATDRMTELGSQDLVIIGLKAHQVGGVAADVRALCGPTTTVVTAQNGIPWWYFFKSGGPHEGTVLESVDPGGVIAKNIDVDRVLGSIVYPAADIVSPGGHPPRRGRPASRSARWTTPTPSACGARRSSCATPASRSASRPTSVPRSG